MNIEKDSVLRGRTVEWFHHESGAEYGYREPQTDSFAVMHPLNEVNGKKYPLYVVFHSAGHDLFSTVGCVPYEGNHDIYRSPDDMFALYLDCRFNESNDWWWGGIDAFGGGNPARHTEYQPVERRVLDTVNHVLDSYPIDRERVYAVGNSMGGSGALGNCMNHGDIYAAIIANVPAGVEHLCDRCLLGREKPEGFSIPEPPVVIDYSAQNDGWSTGHEKLYRGMEAERYYIIGYFGAYGHENNLGQIHRVNDLVLTIDPFKIKKNEAYPAFTHATTDDPIPWPDNCESQISGQVNGFFLYENRVDTAEKFEIELRLAGKDDIKTERELPTESSADVTLRRIQNFVLKPGETVHCTYGEAKFDAVADETGHITAKALKITDKPTSLIITK